MKIFLFLIKILTFLVISTLVQSQNSLIYSEIIETQQDLIEEKKLFDNAIDVPQKIKVEVSLNPKQLKYLKININNVIKQNSFTAFIYTSKGLAFLNANVCAENKIIMPTQNQYDFRFGLLQTQLKTKTILKKVNQKNIDQNNNVYLCVFAYSKEYTKFQIQYTSTKDIINLLSISKFQTVKTEKNISKFYQMQASVQRLIKIVRKSGAPAISIKRCTSKEMSFEKCFQDFFQQKIHLRSLQLVQQNQNYEYQACLNCIVYLKISSQEPTEVEIHLEPIYQELKGKTHRQLIDFQGEITMGIILILSITILTKYYFIFYGKSKSKHQKIYKRQIDDQQRYRLQQND